MDRLQAIENTRFLGREFLLWLWFVSETQDGMVTLPTEDPDKDPTVEIVIDDRIVLEPSYGQGNRHLLSGMEPSTAPETAFALQMNNMPSEMKMKVIRGSQAWAFSLRGEDLLLRSLRIPEVLSQKDDDYLYERIYLLEEMEEILEQLWHLFINARTSPLWDETRSNIQNWIQTKPTLLNI
ncbi:MAG: hypothetical protein EP343_27660 [Deltaproteobacteria bacterium]|nr:MAG: hypothetical protein EP343_27660 [Deltaproteobacteria bacterium]